MMSSTARDGYVLFHVKSVGFLIVGRSSNILKCGFTHFPPLSTVEKCLKNLYHVSMNIRRP